MLTEPEFLVLRTLLTEDTGNQRDVAANTGLSLGTVNSTINKLRDQQHIEGFSVTELGRESLQPYKVDNAIITAAGMSTRFAPLSYERPKGTFVVRGEVLIERTIRQLHEAGITNITIVVGYMKEQFLYLEDDFGVKIVVSEMYTERNSHSSLYLVRNELANSYIIASDYYYVTNPFKPYEYQGYYGAIYQEGAAKEHFVTIGSKDRITKLSYGGSDGWIMYGPAYFDRSFSDAYAKILEETFSLPETQTKLWEDLYGDYIKVLDLKIHRYSTTDCYEFDSLDEVSKFDPDFITNVDSQIFNNITSVLGCERKEICDIAPIVEGLTNQSFYFRVGDKGYVYRHPGVATMGLLNRAAEEAAEKIAYELNLDKTFIYLDAELGWKISEYVDTTEEFDYHNALHVTKAIEMIHTLHDSGITIPSTFDLHEEAGKIKAKMGQSAHLQFADFLELDERNNRLYELASAHGARLVLSHNDFYNPNILVKGEELFLIDWEYSGMSDYASDLGVFICCSDYDYAEAVATLELYFGRELKPAELAHCMAYVSISAYYWFVWALLKESEGESVGEWLYLWYRGAREYGKRADDLFKDLLS